MFKYFLLAAALMVASASASGVKYTDCGAAKELTFFDVQECSGAVCEIHKGKQLDVEAKFTSNQDTKTAKVVATATVNGLDLVLPNIESDGCKFTKCPITKGQLVDIKYKMIVAKELPNVKAGLKIQLIGDHGVMACAHVDGKVEA